TPESDARVIDAASSADAAARPDAALIVDSEVMDAQPLTQDAARPMDATQPAQDAARPMDARPMDATQPARDALSGVDMGGDALTLDAALPPDALSLDAALNPCAPRDFVCGDGACLAQFFVCDEFEDCADGADERGCGEGCPSNTFRCDEEDSFFCLDMSLVCDGYAHCTFGEDELGCP
ncbi:LDL receptor domain-containing protein, partial [Myxococcota bacterium]|nr:LDL receptor domain-containing protein [Myxococcota bacterium]